MLNLGTAANEYVTYVGNETTVYLNDKTFNIKDNIVIESGIPTLQNEIYINDDLIIGSFTIGGMVTELDMCTMPFTYLDKTYMYAYDDIDLMVTYPNTEKDLDLCGYETPNSGFGVDEEGNMYCNNANVNGTVTSDSGTIGGWTINKNGLTNGKVVVNSDGSSTIYTVADLIIIRNHIMEVAGFELPPQMIKHYDFDGDGKVGATDYVLLQKLIGISMSN
jgi:hypothetical protein